MAACWKVPASKRPARGTELALSQRDVGSDPTHLCLSPAVEVRVMVSISVLKGLIGIK